MQTSADRVLVPTRGVYVGLFFVTLTTLMFEVLLTRIYSVMTWYHFAFMAVSIGLFGMTAGALCVHLFPAWFTADRVGEQLKRFSLLFAVSIVVSFLTQLSIPFVDDWSPVQVFSLSLTYLVTAIPFFCSGVCVCLVLTRFPARVGRLYAVDLVGAALGSISLLALLAVFDGVTAVFVVAALASLGAVAFAVDRVGWRRSGTAVGVTVLLVAIVAGNTALFRDGHPFIRILWVKGHQDIPHRNESWNAYSRVVIDGNPQVTTFPFGWGLSPTLSPATRANQLFMTIDGAAATVLTQFNGDTSKTQYLKDDVTNIAHTIRRNAKVFVVGAGGGRDVLSALTFGQRSVTAVEINNRILHLVNGTYGDFTGHLDRNPHVKFVNDEARSWLTRSSQRFDIIQVSLIDTWAASSAGAFALTENSLYTVEAWQSFLHHLDNHGVLSMSRWYLPKQPLEAYRLVSLANATLRKDGVTDPRSHMVMIKSPGPGLNVATLLVSPQPFTGTDLARLERTAATLQFDVVLSPTQAIDNHFLALASARTSRELARAVGAVPGNVAPPTDDKPYFFLMLGFGDVFNHHLSTTAAFGNLARPVQVLFGLSIIVLLATALLIFLPLRFTRQRIPRRNTRPFLLYFAGIGFGFLLIEVSQMQRLVVFLGHPTYALSVVLFSLLLSSGIGSFLTEHLLASSRHWTFLAPLIALLVALIAFGGATPAAIRHYAGSTTPVRIVVAVAILIPLGLLMGMPFPIGMRIAAEHEGTPTALLWGANGATSVCASVLAVAIGLNFGISRAFWTGVAAYTVAAGALAYLVYARDRIKAVDAVEARVGAESQPTLEPGYTTT
jgi:predicted membrane-bound spermidine synthase